ncbi:MAG TPA: hypothetical protein VFA71_01885, partial [Terriglobales bacterium]|nr:hypothetical protein [Terriglobales bacterium]
LPAPNKTTAYLPYWSLGRGIWKGDNLVFIDPHVPRVDLYDKDSLYSSIKVKFPDNAEVWLYDAIVTTSGRLIVSGWYKPDVGEIHDFIGMPDIEGHVSPIIDTGSFIPRMITTCDNGATIWAVGGSRNTWNPNTRVHDPRDVLRQYSFSDGSMKTSLLSTATLSMGPDAANVNAPDQIMQCHNETLGIYMGLSDQWIEYDTNTNQLTRWQLPKRFHHWVEQDSQGKVLPLPTVLKHVTGFVMLDSGDVYASFDDQDNSNGKSALGLFRLQKTGTQATWIPVAGTQGDYKKQGAFKRLEGTDGKNLVYSRIDEQYWYFSSAPN